MQFWTAPLLLACGLALSAAPVQAEDSYLTYLADEYGLLDKDGAKLLLRALSDLNALVDDKDVSVAHLEQLAEFSAQDFYLTGAPLVDGIIAADLDRRPEFPASATFSLIFTEAELRDRFYQGLTDIHGDPDPACLSSTISNWSPQPDRSIAWRAVGVSLTELDLVVSASGPNDANCAGSASPQSHLLSEADMSAFLSRLQTDPPPFNDAKAFQRWLAPYGDVEMSNLDGCYVSALLPQNAVSDQTVDNLAGINLLMVNLNTCADNPGGLSYLSLSSIVDADMFALDKVRRAADGVLGERLENCSDEYATVWVVNEETTLMVSDSYLSISAILYREPPATLGCG